MAVALDLAQLEACLREERRRLDVPGVVAGLRHGDDTHVFADGVAERETRAPVDADTRFRVASITKSFVAALALSLADAGRLDLDEPLGDRATARQLLSHQGGLACEWPSPVDRYGDGDEALTRLATDQPALLPVAPGELFSYSNVGFWLVGAAIARATGGTFEEALHDLLLTPLGLTDTGFTPAAPAAVGYESGAVGDEYRRVEDSYPRVRRPSGGLWSTVGDLLRFGEELAAEPRLREPLVTTADGAYGLGVALTEVDGRRMVGHAGSAAGFRSLLVTIPAEGLVFAALTNSTRGRELMITSLEALGLHAPPQPSRRADEDLAGFAGRFRDPWQEIDVTVDDGGLLVKATWENVLSGERVVVPPARTEAIGTAAFLVLEGENAGDVIDFPRPDLGRFGGLVVPRV